MNNNINNINFINNQKLLFSSLQCEHDKLIRILENKNIDLNKEQIVMFIEINNNIHLLQNLINKLKINILDSSFSNLNSNLNNKKIHEILSNDEKDNIVLETFKPFMIYYRLLLE